MLRAHVYATRAGAERAVAVIDTARSPDGTEEVTLPDGTRERRPAKTWALPIELDDGRCAVPWKGERLTALSGREVTVRGERVRVPRADDVVELETEEQPDGRVVVREKRAPLPAPGPRPR